MEGFYKAIMSADLLPSSSFKSGTVAGGTVSGSSDHPAAASLLLTRPPRRAVSLLTCSKLCGFCFVAGIVVGFTLKQRLRRWASKLLRKIKDD